MLSAGAAAVEERLPASASVLSAGAAAVEERLPASAAVLAAESLMEELFLASFTLRMYVHVSNVSRIECTFLVLCSQTVLAPKAPAGREGGGALI